MAEQLNIILVPHTHWDREWYQTFQQFRMRLVHVVTSLLDILDRDPAFTHFMLDGQAIVLDDYLEACPDQEERLKHYIRSGRISAGPWYLQPDEFLVSGESLIRNLQSGLSRAAEFGEPMRIGYVPDTFGHIAQLPQILRGVGIDNAVFWRGVGAEARQSEFFWNAPDGSQVLVLHLTDIMGYSNARDMPLSPDEFVTRTLLLAANLLPKATISTLLFMNGSDHLSPQEGLPAAIAAANERLAHLSSEQTKVLAGFEPPDRQKVEFDSINVRIGSLSEYVEIARQSARQAGAESLQTLTGEMRSSQYAPLLESVLSTRMWIKQRNTATEHLLERWVEPLTAWAALQGAPYPQGLVHLAWKYLLHNHPHDSICGCSIDQVHRENRVRFDQSEQIGEQLVTEAMQQLVARVDTRPPVALSAPSGQADRAAIPLVVFNPAPGPRSEAVQVDIHLAALDPQAVIVDERGAATPFTVLKSERKELGSMPLAREMVAAAVALQGSPDPGEFIRMAESSISSFLEIEGQPATGLEISGAQLRESSEQPGTALFEIVLTPRGQVEVHRESLLSVEQHLLALLEREDIHTLVFTITDMARATIEFVAADLPAYGFKTYWLYPHGLPAGVRSSGSSRQARQAATTPTFIENEFYRVEADPTDGTLVVTDRQAGTVYAGLNRFIDGGDVGDLYNYSPPAHDLLIDTLAASPEITVDISPVRSQLCIRSSMALPVACSPDRQSRDARRVDCEIRSEVTLTPGMRRIDIHTSVDNRARDHMLRVTFPVSYTVETASAEGVFEVRERPAFLPRPPDVAEWVEEPVNRFPQKRFVEVSDGTHALGVLNRGLPEYEIITGADGHQAIAVTLLRCVEWLSRGDLTTRRGHAGPALFTPEAQCQGLNVFDYALVPHSGNWESEDALVLREAQAFNTPARAVVSDQHSGALPSTMNLVEVTPPGLVVSAIKRPREGDGLIVRVYNPSRHAVEAAIRPGFNASHASVTNLLEEPQEQLSWNGDGSLHLGLRAGEIATLHLT
jgi:mannosylglycerate hydrolase